MKKSIFIVIFLISSTLIFGQEEKALGVFESDTTWLKEIIEFPIGFAPDIKYEGYEDLRFAKKWRDKSHDEFWCYTFAWHIKNPIKQNVEILETNIKLYYDGLMEAVNKKKGYKVPETTVLFIKTDKNDQDIDYIGKIHVYDSFNIEDMITLNVKVKVNHCENKKSSTVVFQLSPQNFNHDIWKRFYEVKLKANFCD
ncbi:hypothetical protein [Psychroserpens ponticola]|uniref:Uncharacterized protein n=1 Tax=Psychroserpens ponticola TaxID=2932268 RepID=A0ABY7S1R4_9FLAO|nr:hypothetical protein [Psychroserpens ponticola]WCO03124.1 hypothetical protein MUN68_006425 [Psychroserpens ponticola]